MHTTAVQLETPREGRFSWASLSRLAGLLCLGLSWLMPNHYLPWYAFHSDAMAFIAMFAWLLGLHLEGDSRIAVPGLALIVAAAAAIPWLQYAGGLIGFAGEAWLATLYLGGLAGSIIIGHSWARRPDANDVLLQTVVAATLAAGLVSTGLCFFQWLLLEDWLGIFIANTGSTGRPFANLAQPNLLATLLIMSIVALVWTYESRRIGAWGLACGAVFLTIGLSSTQSRAGYVSAAALCCWWFAKQPSLPAPRMNRWWAIGWLVLLAALAIALPRLSMAFELAGAERPTPLLGSAGRWVMWQQIASGILQSPWVGYGWDHTAAAQLAGAVGHPGILAAGYAHNIALDALAWFGVPLGTALCAFGLLWLVRRAREARGPLPVFACAFMLPVLVHSLFEFPFAYAFFLVPVGIMLGVVAAHRPGAAVVRIPRAWLAPLVIGLAALGFQIAREYVPAEEDFRFLRFEALSMGNTPQAHVRPQFLVLTQIDALLDVGRTKPAPGMTREQIDRVKYVTAKYAWAPPAFIYAGVLEANGLHEEAAHQMQGIHGVYGDTYYRGAAERLEEMRNEWKQGASAPRP